MEPPNNGHVGDNNSAVLSFIERLSSLRSSKCTKTIGRVIFGTSNSVLCKEIYYTVSLKIFRGSTIRGSTVIIYLLLHIWFKASFVRTTICDLYAEMVQGRHFLMFGSTYS